MSRIIGLLFPVVDKEPFKQVETVEVEKEEVKPKKKKKSNKEKED